MNTYLMSIRHYFRGEEEFTILAENKQEAVREGLLYVRSNPKYRFGGNYNLDSVKCIKKLYRRKE